MSAYVIGDINVTNPDIFAEYAERVPMSSSAYGGRYLVRGPDKCESCEGDWNPRRFVLAEYKDVATVKSWYYSDDYIELTKLRQKASTGTLLVAEGVESHIHGNDSGNAGYIVGDIEVTDSETYAQYAAGVPATVAAYGGRYLIRGVSGEVLEGDWIPKRLDVLEFDTIQRAKEWYSSPEYADLKKIRHSASNGNLIFANGA